MTRIRSPSSETHFLSPSTSLITGQLLTGFSFKSLSSTFAFSPYCCRSALGPAEQNVLSVRQQDEKSVAHRRQAVILVRRDQHEAQRSHVRIREPENVDQTEHISPAALSHPRPSSLSPLAASGIRGIRGTRQQLAPSQDQANELIAAPPFPPFRH